MARRQRPASDRPMRFGYADPPYPGCGWRYPENAEVDHADLIGRLVADFPDGWALSTSSPALRDVLPLCPPAVRVLAWVKPFCAWKAHVTIAHAWEPVIFWGGRRRPRNSTVRDWHAEPITLRRGVVGAKPGGFCHWLLDVFNVQPGDDVVDLFPGSGAMTRTAQQRCQPAAQYRLDLTCT